MRHVSETDVIVEIGALGILADEDRAAGTPIVVLRPEYSNIPVDLRVSLLKCWQSALQKHLENCEFEQAMSECNKPGEGE